MPPALVLVLAVSIAVSTAVATGCRHANCEHIENNRCVDAAVDGARACASTAECPAAMVCDLPGSGICVTCTEAQPGACTGATPVCGADHACHGCASHGECLMSNACLPDGTCAETKDVAYVEPAKPAEPDSVACTRAVPCTHVADGLATGRPYVKLHGTFNEAVTVGGGQVVTLLADPGATLSYSGSGRPVLTIQDDDTALAIYDLAIADARDAGTIGIAVRATGAPRVVLTHVTISGNPGGGISIAGGSLTLTRSIVSQNLGGGVLVSGTTSFVVIGNLFFDNGGPGSPVGAIGIATLPAAGNRLEFNSFTKNAAQDGIGAAIQCVAGAFTARNNILFANGTSTNLAQVGGSCGHAYSIVHPGAVPPGAENLDVDPLFKDPVNHDLHVLPGSPAIATADPHADLAGPAARDRDGVVRAAPATRGAYQVPPSAQPLSQAP